jgi:hypothetical protein
MTEFYIIMDEYMVNKQEQDGQRNDINSIISSTLLTFSGKIVNANLSNNSDNFFKQR